MLRLVGMKSGAAWRRFHLSRGNARNQNSYAGDFGQLLEPLHLRSGSNRALLLDGRLWVLPGPLFRKASRGPNPRGGGMRTTRHIILAAVLGCTAFLWGQAAPSTPGTSTQPQSQTQTAPSATPQADRPVADPPDPPAGEVMLTTTDHDKTKPAAPPTEALAPTSTAVNFDQVVDRITARELIFLQNLRQFQPMVETYLQYMKPDKELGAIPSKDQYFLGRLELQTGRAQ